MRPVLGMIGLLFCASTGCAQSIDIGGVAVSIGDDPVTAMNKVKQALPPEFSVARVHISRGAEPVDTTSQWIVSAAGAPGQIPSKNIASVFVKDGLISRIAKYYDLGDGSNLAEAYTAAMRDAQRNAFEHCTTSQMRLQDGTVWSIRTVCGAYTLDFNLSWTNKTGLGRSATSISVLVSPAKSPSR